MNVKKQDEIEKAIYQILTAAGTLEEDELLKYLAPIRKEFGERERPLKEHFGRLNNNLRLISFEIKSVLRVKCLACDAVCNVKASICENCSEPSTKSKWVHYHGIVNTEEDDVSKNFGSDLLPDELKFFSDLIQKLLENNYLSTDDIYRFKNDKWKGSQTDVVLEKLRERGWLQRDSRSFWEIGMRTHLELRTFIEDSIRSLEDDDDEGTHAKNIHEQLAKLPQITTY